MCGRFEAFTREQVEEVLEDIREGRVRPLTDDASPAHARPGSNVTAIGASLEMHDLRWGVNHPKDKALMINARIESADFATWKQAFELGRVIVPARAYFEPHENESERINGRERKRQYRFCSPDKAPLLLAGVSLEGKLAIVTTNAHDDIADIHPRMPLCLTVEDALKWVHGAWRDVSPNPPVDIIAAPEFGGEQLSLF